MNGDFAQCILFDGNGPEARLTGIEYIISEKLFQNLPEEEQQYWHPHNFEILSGQLVAPAIPEIAEHELMLLKMNSYGKTWHVWDTSGPIPSAAWPGCRADLPGRQLLFQALWKRRTGNLQQPPTGKL